MVWQEPHPWGLSPSLICPWLVTLHFRLLKGALLTSHDEMADHQQSQHVQSQIKNTHLPGFSSSPSWNLHWSWRLAMKRSQEKPFSQTGYFLTLIVFDIWLYSSHPLKNAYLWTKRNCERESSIMESGNAVNSGSQGRRCRGVVGGWGGKHRRCLTCASWYFSTLIWDFWPFRLLHPSSQQVNLTMTQREEKLAQKRLGVVLLLFMQWSPDRRRKINII